MEPSPFHLSPITGSHTVTEKKNLVLEMGPYFYLSTNFYLFFYLFLPIFLPIFT